MLGIFGSPPLKRGVRLFRTMRYILTWLVLAVVIAVGIGSLNWLSYRSMETRGVSGQGTVIELLPKIHNTVRYEYHVRGQSFEGRMQAWRPNPPLEQLSVGQSLVIYYDPEHPEKSVLGDPKGMIENETISVALATIIFSTFLVVAWARASRKHAH